MKLKEGRNNHRFNINGEPENSKDVFLDIQNLENNLNSGNYGINNNRTAIIENNNATANIENNNRTANIENNNATANIENNNGISHIENNNGGIPNNDIPILYNNNNDFDHPDEKTGSTCDCEFVSYIIVMILSKIGIIFLIFMLISFINVSVMFVFYMAGMSFFFSLWFALIDYIFCGCCTACGIAQLADNCCVAFFVGIGCSLFKWNIDTICYFCRKLCEITPCK